MRIKRQIYLHKTSTLIIVAFVTFIAIYMCMITIHNKHERWNFIRNYDVFNNESNYYYIDTNSKFLDYKKMVRDIEIIRNEINRINDDQIVYHRLFHSVNRITAVIVIQVHDRIKYLSHVIDSLRNVLGITRTLLVFSHDYFNGDINKLIGTINFASHIQIFYPYSTQLHPRVFPGEDPKYCTKGWKCKIAEGERNYILAQVKHHWWWKVNHVFDNLDIMQKYDGIVLFLEDDQYVTEDVIYVLKLLERLMIYECPDCYLISVGAELPQLKSYHTTQGALSIDEFGTTPYNMGIAFNRSIWNDIKRLSHHFCYFNDFSWATSLRYLGSKMNNGKLLMISIAGPRVFHFGRCGLQSVETDCDIKDKMHVLKKFFKLIRKGLFPRNYSLNNKQRPKSNIVERGNFSDIRDHELCMYFSTKMEFGV